MAFIFGILFQLEFDVTPVEVKERLFFFCIDVDSLTYEDRVIAARNNLYNLAIDKSYCVADNRAPALSNVKIKVLKPTTFPRK